MQFGVLCVCRCDDDGASFFSCQCVNWNILKGICKANTSWKWLCLDSTRYIDMINSIGCYIDMTGCRYWYWDVVICIVVELAEYCVPLRRGSFEHIIEKCIVTVALQGWCETSETMTIPMQITITRTTKITITIQIARTRRIKITITMQIRVTTVVIVIIIIDNMVK